MKAAAKPVEGYWSSSDGRTYRTHGAIVIRVDGVGAFCEITPPDPAAKKRVRGPFASALTAMEQADRMLAEAAATGAQP